MFFDGYGANCAKLLGGCTASVSCIATSNSKVCPLRPHLQSPNIALITLLLSTDILLTTPAFSSLTPDSARPTLETLPTPPSPLIKLTDFGLSRFIEVDENTGEGELLWTRCGSEAYAAPELVMGTGSVRAQAARKRRSIPPTANGEGGDDNVRGFYDARETDAWACGVVLYALVGRRLPFGEGVGAAQNQQQQNRIGGDGAPGYGHGRGRGSVAERRHWLMRIARGEYEWPDVNANASSVTNGEDSGREELVGQTLVKSEGAKRIVGRLLVRDARKRARIMDLWDDAWMWGPGGGLAVDMTQEEWRERERERERDRERVGLGVDFGEAEMRIPQIVKDGEDTTIDTDYVDEGRFLDEGLGDGGEGEEGEEEECDEVVDGEEGWLLDQEGIGSVARQEVV